MFKPLLRTLPTLSGNFTVACKLREFDKENTNEYSTYVRLANMMPLQNFMANKNIEINLLNGKYEHDVAKYHHYYSDVFYKSNFSYNKNNYAILDLDSIYNYNNDSRNKDYEFGCKRIQYSQNGSQFNFYAPIYVDNENDLPEYFCINLVFNDHLTKKIKIYINKDNKRNYLKNYLSRYLKQIDECVIFCLPESMQATYFGIDVENGGIVQYKDNVIGDLYRSQKTINNFDYTICKGFERNHMIMRQIIPLSFSFNINDLFNNYEREFFNGAKIKVYGHYHTYGNTIYDMYDFDINYTNAYQKFNKYNEYSGRYEFVVAKNSDKELVNIMDVSFPGLNEGRYIKYAYTNKITPMYCKFKMMLSDDRNPYITNVSYSYSYSQYPNKKYGEFPTMFKGIFPKVLIDNLDLKLPIGASLDKYYKLVKNVGNKLVLNTNNVDKYNKLMSNYCSSWYNIGDYIPDFNDNNFVDNFFNNSNWVDVKYGYSYFNGVLYNFNEIEDLDKFAIFCGPHMNYISKESLYNDMIKADLILSSEISASGNKTFNYNQSYNMKLYDSDNNFTYYNKLIDVGLNINKNNVKINQNMIKDIYGTYIVEDNYIEENTFYKVNDLLSKFEYYFNIPELLDKIFEKQINGYELLEGYNNINYFEDIADIYGNVEKQFMFINRVYDTEEYSDKYSWLYDLLYYSTQTSLEKHKVSERYNSIFYNEDVNGKLCMFIKTHFIHKNDLINILKEYKEDLSKYGDLNSLLRLCFIYFAENNPDASIHTISNIDMEISTDNIERYSLNKWIRLQLGNKLYKEFINNSAYSKFRKLFIEMIETYNDNVDLSYNDIYPSEEIYGSNLIFLLDYLTEIQSYKYNVIGNYNGLEIDNYFNKNKVNLLNVYVDPYNIKKYISLYNKKYKNNKITSDFKYTKFFIEILDKNHLIEFFNNLKETDSEYNSLVNTDINLFDIIYVKERCWVIEKNKIYCKDRYITLYEYLYNKISELGNIQRRKYRQYTNIEEREAQIELENKFLTSLHEYLTYLIYIYKENDNKSMLDLLNSSLSDIKGETNNFNFIINLVDEDVNITWNINLSLCIYRNVILFNDELRKLVTNGYFLYLYIPNESFATNLNTWPIISENDIYENKYIYKDTNEYLTPLFTNIYFNESDNSSIKNMIDNDKINQNNKYVVNTNKYFKEIDVDNIFKNLIESNDTRIYNIINNINNLNNDNDLINDIKNDVTNIFYIQDNVKSTILTSSITSLIKNKDGIINKLKNNLFSYGWLNELKLIEDIDYINDVIDNWNKYCSYNDIYLEDIDENTYIERIDIILNYLKEHYNEVYYLIIKHRGIILYSINNVFNITYDSIIANNGLQYNNELKLYTYMYNGKKYGFYYINIDIDNTNNSFNVVNDYNININFNSICGIEINDSKFNSYFKKIFYLLEPFLKLNIFNEFTKQVSTIIYPNELEIDVNYMSLLLNDESMKQRYKLMNTNNRLYIDIAEMGKLKKIKLLRYFNYITPLLLKTNIIKDTWELQFMGDDNKTRNTKKYNILSKEDINIYKYNHIKYYDGMYSAVIEDFVENGQKEIPDILSQYEYKHFNDNSIYNLPEEIIIEDDKTYTQSELKQYQENKEEIIKEKKNILLKYFKDLGLDYNNIILFLFNKYDSSMIFDPIKLRASKNEKIYKISYKFNLI